MEEVNPRLNSKTGGLTYSAAVVFYFALSLIASLIITAAKLENGSDAYLYINYLVSPIAIGICIATILSYKKLSFKSIFPVKCHPKYYLIGLLLIYGLLFSLSWVNEVSVKFFGLFGYEPREAGSYLPNLSGGYSVLAILVIAVLPAFCEELLFHGSPEQTVYQFIAGCAFAFLAVRSRSILPSVMMHFINNALIIIFAACNLYGEDGNLIISSGGNIALTVTSALALVGAVIWLILDKTPLKKCEKGGVKLFFIFASVGIAALGLLWLLSLFGVG